MPPPPRRAVEVRALSRGLIIGDMIGVELRMNAVLPAT